MSLWNLIRPGEAGPEQTLADAEHRVSVRELPEQSVLHAELEVFRGKCVLVMLPSQLLTALALIELDGVASRLVLAVPGLSPADIENCLEVAGVDIIVLGSGASACFSHAGRTVVVCAIDRRAARPCARAEHTEWALFTSGTTGSPRLVLHTILSLTRLPDRRPEQAGIVWAAFYDIRRYGGLQILLRALTGGHSIVLGSEGESLGDFLARAARAGVTHISGTPSHWRRALSLDATAHLALLYIRLGGEICDQPILDRLHRRFPDTCIAHAFASTETGVVFSIEDGVAGFPASLLATTGHAVEVSIRDGSLHVRSPWTARGTLPVRDPPLANGGGFIDTGDMVERRGDRYHFLGRRNGTINVGGAKVSPEFVETVINRHPAVLASRVSARRSPITGSIVVCEFVIEPAARASGADPATIKSEVLALCRQSLAVHEVPVSLTVVEFLDLGTAGKLSRQAQAIRAEP